MEHPKPNTCRTDAAVQMAPVVRGVRHQERQLRGPSRVSAEVSNIYHSRSEHKLELQARL